MTDDVWPVECALCGGDVTEGDAVQHFLRVAHEECSDGWAEDYEQLAGG